MTIVMQAMLRCLDARLEVFAFGKWHRPAAYHASWRVLKRRLEQQ